MDYLVTFLEGIITFVSPCLLPMLPIYLAYFAGSSNETIAAVGAGVKATRATVVNALGFVCGFTVVFVCLGAFAGTFGAMLSQHQTVLNVVCGAIVIVLGLHFTGLVRIAPLDRTLKPASSKTPSGFFSAIVFGIFFSIGWTPCVGTFLGSALMLASAQGSMFHGVGLLLAYSLGLGIPFVLCALLIEYLGGALSFVKSHYRAVNIVCGVLLVIVGVLMATGWFSTWLGMLSL